MSLDVDLFINNVPDSWDVIRVRFLLQDGAEGIKIGPFGSALKLDDMVDNGFKVFGQENVIKRNFSRGKRFISSSKFEEMSVYRVKPRDILITMMGTSGKCEVVPDDVEDGIIDSHLVRIRVREDRILHSFFRLLIDECSDVRAQIDYLGKGSIMHGLNSTIIKSLTLPLPSLGEQQLIMRFLNVELSQIDNLIAEKQRFIALLKEKRQSLITHFVTKGLDPNVPMKDSGVEWIGEVPEHWEVKKLKNIKGTCNNSFVDGPFGSNLKSEHFIDNGDVYVIESNFATQGKINSKKLKTISNEHYETIKRSETFEGAIIIAKIGAQYGKCAILPSLNKKAVVSGNSISLRVNNKICDVEYVYLFLTHLKSSNSFELIVNMTAQPALSLGLLNQVKFCVPSLVEQKEIVHKVYELNNQIDSLINECNISINLLKERRSALITAAVTGKIDVINNKEEGI